MMNKDDLIRFDSFDSIRLMIPLIPQDDATCSTEGLLVWLPLVVEVTGGFRRVLAYFCTVYLRTAL
jgi:hypothetical protein